MSDVANDKMFIGQANADSPERLRLRSIARRLKACLVWL